MRAVDRYRAICAELDEPPPTPRVAAPRPAPESSSDFWAVVLKWIAQRPEASAVFGVLTAIALLSALFADLVG